MSFDPFLVGPRKTMRPRLTHVTHRTLSVPLQRGSRRHADGAFSRLRRTPPSPAAAIASPYATQPPLFSLRGITSNAAADRLTLARERAFMPAPQHKI